MLLQIKLNGSKKEILVIKNMRREGPGLLEEVFKERGVGYTIIDFNKNTNVPAVENFGAVIVLGGSDNANDNTDKMKNELDLVSKTIAAGIPFLGICLGFQLLVKAAGGKVVYGPLKEVGFIDPEGNNFTVELTEAGKNDPLFTDLRQKFNVFHLHSETVELTDEMILLAVGKFCRNQIAKIGLNAYGIQGHFELTPEMFEVWINEDPDLIGLDKKQLQTNFEAIKYDYIHVGKQLFKNFLKTVGY